MIKLELQNVLDYLKDKKIHAQIQQETQQIFVVFNLDGQQFPLFIRVDKESKILQLFMFIPSTITPTAISDTARLLHALNKEIDIPGFGLEEKAGVVFYRAVLPCPTGELDEVLFNSFLVAIPSISRVCFPLISQVATGKTKFDSISGNIHETLKKYAPVGQEPPKKEPPKKEPPKNEQYIRP